MLASGQRERNPSPPDGTGRRRNGDGNGCRQTGRASSPDRQRNRSDTDANCARAARPQGRERTGPMRRASRCEAPSVHSGGKLGKASQWPVAGRRRVKRQDASDGRQVRVGPAAMPAPFAFAGNRMRLRLGNPPHLWGGEPPQAVEGARGHKLRCVTPHTPSVSAARCHLPTCGEDEGVSRAPAPAFHRRVPASGWRARGLFPRPA